MKVFNDLKTRGVGDILIAVTDGLKGMPEALGAVFPQTTLQTCIVHLIRNSLDLRQLEGSQGAGGGDQADLHGASAEPLRLNSTPSSKVPGARSSRPWSRPGAGPGIA
jgi:putative transposase